MKDYKKILEGLVNIINNTEKSDIGFANICTFIGENCPELKEYEDEESEDERIRKVLIGWINLEPSTSFNDTFDGFSKEQILAWLEKQGEQNHCMIQWKGDNLKEVIDFTGKDYNFEKWFKYFEEYEKYVQEHDGIFKLFNADGSHYEVPVGAWIVKTPDGYNVASKAILRQKRVDTPKFKVGDWCIDNEDGTIFQIVKVLDNTYTYRTNEGKKYSCSHYTLELDARFWNMSDAKEGDVLVDSLGNVCIYQEPSTKLMYRSHCYGSHKDFMYMGGSHEIVGSYPATKEQRDQLEKTMADAGYAFDFEKKELKEIENEEYDGEDYGIDSLWHAKNILEKTLGEVEGYQTDDGILDHKCAISFIDKLYKQKPAEWSEDDESNFQGIIDELKANKHHAPDSDLPTYDRFFSWFKSLKERYVWKPSDEQMKILSTYANVNDVLASLYQDLKKLKE